MLEEARMTQGNRHTYLIFTDNDVISSQWGGGDALSLPIFHFIFSPFHLYIT